jgi:protease-4
MSEMPERPIWPTVVVAALLAGCFVVGILLLFGAGPAERSAATGTPKAFGIGVVHIGGIIMSSADSGPFGIPRRRGAEEWVRRLDDCARNRRVKAVVLRIDSPGGTVGAAQEIARAVRRVRAAKKPVVASLADVAASGGYYVAAGADRIVANLNYSGLMKRYGVSAEVVKSGRHKDGFSPYRPMTDEERRLFQGLVDECYRQFLEEVASGRKIPLARLRRIADGRVLTGSQAKEAGLVDELGDFRRARAVAGEMAGLGEDPAVVFPERAAMRDYIDFLDVRLPGREAPLSFPSASLPPVSYLCPGFAGGYVR